MYSLYAQHSKDMGPHLRSSPYSSQHPTLLSDWFPRMSGSKHYDTPYLMVKWPTLIFVL
jgi:hypothetical protein